VQKAYFTNYNYIIPKDAGNIMAYDKSAPKYSDTLISNEYTYEEGVIQPGETAVIWSYAPGAKGKTVADFRANFGENLSSLTKVFVMETFNTAADGASDYSKRIGLADTNDYMYGLAKRADLNMEDTATAGEDYPAVIPEAITYVGRQYSETGINVSDVESFVFRNSAAVLAKWGTANTSNGVASYYGLGSGVSALYCYKGVKGNAIGAYKQMGRVTTAPGNIGQYYTSTGATSKSNYWGPQISVPDLNTWKVNPGVVQDGQFPGTYEIPTVKYTIEAVGYQNHLTDPDTLRIAVVFDSLDYAQVGVDVHMQYVSDQYVIAHPDATFNVWTAYEALSGMDGDTKMTYAASDFGGTYIGAIVLKDLGQDPGLFPATPVVITVKPWTLTEGGVKEYGAEKSFTYEIPLS
jgi:hypothetical protein